MAGNSIGSLAISLTAESSQFDTAIDAAKNKLAGLGSVIAGMAAVGAATAGLAMAFSQVVALGAAADDLHDTAAALDMTAEGLIGLKSAAALSGAEDTLEAGLNKLQRELGAVIAGSDEAKKKFDALNLSGEMLASVPLDEAFLRIVDQLNELPTQAQRGAAAFEIFGKQGQKFLELIGKGRDFIEERIGKAAERGLVLDPEFGAAFERYEAAKQDFTQSLQGLKQVVLDSFVVPLLNAATKFFQLMADGVDLASRALKALGFMRDRSPAGRAQEGDAAVAAARQKVERDAIANIHKETEAARLRVETFGLATSAAKAYEAIARAGAAATKEFVAEVRERQRLERELEDLQAGAKVFEGNRTDLERFQSQMEEWNGLLARGAIGEDTFALAVGRAVEQLEKQYDLQQKTSFLPSLLERGTQAERTFTLKADQDMLRAQQDPQKRVEDLLKSAAARDQVRNNTLRELAEAAKKASQPKFVQF